MPNPVSSDIITTLIADNTVPTGRGFFSRAPVNAPTETFCVMQDVGGTTNPKWLRDNARLVVNVHGAENNYVSGHTMAQNIKDALLGRKPFTIVNVIYARIVTITDITFIGYDDNNRPIFTMVFEVTRDYTNTDTNRLPIA